MTDEVEQTETHHEAGKQRPEIRWGVIASVAAHIPIVALLIFGLPKIQPKPAEDESVKVELVPPPEEKKPEPKPEVKPPEPKPPQETKKEPSPPPPPPPPPPPSPEAAKPQPEAPRRLSVTRPLLEFAEKDSAPKKTEKGLPQQAEAPRPPVADVKPKEAPAEPSQPQKPVVPEAMPAADPMPRDIELPQVETAEVNPEKSGPAATGQDEAKTNFEQAEHPKESVPTPSAAGEAKVKKSEELTKAKTLYSENAISDSAINNLPRSKRIDLLCRTELQQQLIHAPVLYHADLLPSFPLANISGNVLNGAGGAFQSSGLWYDVTLICEVDSNARKVVAFRFDVGDKIPKSQWKSRGFLKY